MRLLLAPDSFKGSLSATEISESMARGARKVFSDAELVSLPLSDGGEGLVESLVKATRGKVFRTRVTGPLGKPVDSFWGILGDKKTAVVEMAAASGLTLVPDELKNPLTTTTYGTGELIKDALDRGCNRIIIGIGGSATNDGGAGMAQALGAKLFDDAGHQLPFGGIQLSRLANIDKSAMDVRILESEVLVACDVDNPLTGKNGASYIYGPQKGATPNMVRDLDKSLQHYARIIRRDLKVAVEHIPGAGAAGGLGAGIVAFLQGDLTSGIDLVMEAVGLEKQLIDSDLVLTGEGKLDYQSLFGKVPVGVARRAKKHGVPVVVLAGIIEENIDILHAEGITAYFSIANGPMSQREAMETTSKLVELTTVELLLFWKRFRTL